MASEELTSHGDEAAVDATTETEEAEMGADKDLTASGAADEEEVMAAAAESEVYATEEEEIASPTEEAAAHEPSAAGTSAPSSRPPSRPGTGQPVSEVREEPQSPPKLEQLPAPAASAAYEYHHVNLKVCRVADPLCFALTDL